MKTIPLHLAPLAVALTASGCDVGGIFGTSLNDELADARARWESYLVEIYEIDFQRSLCECLPESTTPVRIRVNQNSVVSAVRLSDGEQLPDEQLDLYLTVEQLFDRIEDVVDADPFRLEVEYDDVHGFPLFVSWDEDSAMADDEIEFTMDNLIVITTYPKNPSPR